MRIENSLFFRLKPRPLLSLWIALLAVPLLERDVRPPCWHASWSIRPPRWQWPLWVLASSVRWKRLPVHGTHLRTLWHSLRKRSWLRRERSALPLPLPLSLLPGCRRTRHWRFLLSWCARSQQGQETASLRFRVHRFTLRLWTRNHRLKRGGPPVCSLSGGFHSTLFGTEWIPSTHVIAGFSLRRYLRFCLALSRPRSKQLIEHVHDHKIIPLFVPSP